MSLMIGSDVGFGFGAAVRPLRNVDRLLFLAGGRVGAGGDGLRPMIGLAWELGRVQLFGCKLQGR
jgi:hypothetical protein